MISFGIRNFKVFFKDKASVFFSLLAAFIIIGLYALFLGDVLSGDMGDLPEARFLMDSWIMAGLLAVTTVTTTMGAFGIMVQDKERKIVKDFSSSPVSYRNIVGGYIFGAMMIGIIMSVIAFVLAEIYIVANGGKLLSIINLLKVFGLIVLSTLCNTSFILFIVSFLKSSNAYGTASSILGTLIGFITGIYIPIGVLPVGVQWVVKCFPVSHAAALFRQVMMESPLEKTFAGAPPETIANFKESLGVVFTFGDTTASPLVSILVLIVSAIIFYCLSLYTLSRKSK